MYLNNTIEFISFFDKYEKIYKIHIDSDIIGYIYSLFKFNYNNYNLLELINILLNNNIVIKCELHKPELIQVIIDNKIYLPEKTEQTPSKWDICKMNNKFYIEIDDNIVLGQDDCITFHNYNEPCCYKILELYMNYYYMEDDDFVLFAVIEDIYTEEVVEISIKDLIEIIDCNDNDITLNSLFINYML